MKVDRRTHIENMLIKIQKSVTSDTDEFDMVSPRKDAPDASMEVRSLSDFSRGLVPRQIASVFMV